MIGLVRRRASRSSLVAALVATSASCAHATPALLAPHAASVAKKEGAALFALPGNVVAPFVIAGAPNDVVRGRVRFHLDPDGGATRARTLTREPTTAAMSLPAWLGGGVALVSDGGLSILDGSVLRPIVRGAIMYPSIGAHELWARARSASSGDWLRIDLSSAKPKITYDAPPIAAPILTTFAAPGSALAGRVVTAGPEFTSPKIAFAIVELLGPIATHDGGDTWAPLDHDAISTAFPGGSGPTRVLRESYGAALANDERMVPLSPTGQLGAPIVLGKSHDVTPDSTSIRFETSLLRGVVQPDGDVLVSDGGRLSIESIDPPRVLRVSRPNELTRCDLRPTTAPGALALAVCTRHDDGPVAAGAQLVVGPVVEGVGGLHVVPERVFPFPSAFRFAGSGALAVAGSCNGNEAGGNDLRYVAKVCVRDEQGAWHESVLAGVTGRIALTPLLDGGVVVARDDKYGLELLSLPRDAISTTLPVRFRVDAPPMVQHRELIELDEIAAGKLVVWRKAQSALEGMSFELGPGKLKMVARNNGTLLEDGMFGVYGDHAMIAKSHPAPKGTIAGEPRFVVDSLTILTDAGAHWPRADWPEAARILESPSAGGRLECGALGCKVFGWARVGWQTHVSSYDEIVDLSSATELPPPKDPPSKSTTLSASCVALSPPSPIDAAKVPFDRGPTFPFARAALLGGVEPKVATGQILVVSPLQNYASRSPAVRGGLFAWGPQLGAWNDLSRVFARFSSDLDPIGTVHETVPVVAPFADRDAAQRLSLYAAAYALGPGRIFVSACESSRCFFFRAVDGMPLERIDLSSVGEIQAIHNARELGGTLLVVGMATAHETSKVSGKSFESRPFAALVSGNGVTSSFFSRASGGPDANVVATLDPVRGRFGLELTSPLPTWTGGATYVLPLDAGAHASGAFESLFTAHSEIGMPKDPCSLVASGWDRGEQNRRRTVLLRIGAGEQIAITSEGATIRERLTSSGACLDRFTIYGDRAAFQLDPSTGHAVYVAVDANFAAGKKQELTCKVSWQLD